MDGRDMSAEVRRVVVGVSGSIANVPALRVAVDRAQAFGVPLVAVLAWSPVGGELAYQCRPCPPILRVCSRRPETGWTWPSNRPSVRSRRSSHRPSG